MLSVRPNLIRLLQHRHFPTNLTLGELDGTLDADQPLLVAIRTRTIKELKVQGGTSELRCRVEYDKVGPTGATFD